MNAYHASQIKRDGERVRPSFYFIESEVSASYDTKSIAAQLLESLRNLHEAYAAESCCVLERIATAVERIDRRLAKSHPLPKGRHKR